MAVNTNLQPPATAGGSDQMIEVQKIYVMLGGRKVLCDISFELCEGEIIALLGPNGAGKTTLIRAMNGTVPLTGGEILLDGQPIDKMSRRQMARRIAVVA